ncbi:hypothetical protein LX36DRAFT_655014 [Colletotrichum falcatum]|nr:hypothetical protein LX36DRAFT_655014 [Colletotrichum falcatum]
MGHSPHPRSALAPSGIFSSQSVSQPRRLTHTRDSAPTASHHGSPSPFLPPGCHRLLTSKTPSSIIPHSRQRRRLRVAARQPPPPTQGLGGHSASSSLRMHPFTGQLCRQRRIAKRQTVNASFFLTRPPGMLSVLAPALGSGFASCLAPERLRRRAKEREKKKRKEKKMHSLLGRSTRRFLCRAARGQRLRRVCLSGRITNPCACPSSELSEWHDTLTSRTSFPVFASLAGSWFPSPPRNARWTRPKP